MSAPLLTKTGFLAYRDCPKSFWLSQYRPGLLIGGSPSAFDRMLAKDGYAVEALAREMLGRTQKPGEIEFQVVFEAGGCHARADAVRRLADGRIEIIEVKSSSSVANGGHDHRIDAAFQVVVAHRSGFDVAGVTIIHANPGYVRFGEVVAENALVEADLSADVFALLDDVQVEIDAALDLLSQASIDETGCGCRHHGSIDRRCAAFAHLNPDVDERSAHLLPRISAARLQKLDQENRLSIDAVGESDVTAAQLSVLRALKSGHAVIDRAAIAAFLADVQYPIFYYDYEAFGSAIPLSDGMSPHAQIPFQFSAHVEQADGSTEHIEFLASRQGQHGELLQALGAALPSLGSVISWNAPYEKGCNRRLAALLPEHSAFLEDIDARTIDLMVPFKAAYVHPAFKGSTSIKKVLPVICPDLSYSGFEVSDGAAAMEAWSTMIGATDPDERAEIARSLREYCGLDSWAMVRVMQFLRGLIAS